ncbi:hypothetical protein A6A04_03955 [Paramagnetospirillum marisnigri]|uniref:Uncharacterized protein n=1 Tax=Paramagnetospirillum marisnigri TaxID=1285242 RepID=A0A178ML01_9PROT|nr:hypothetical protein [Paramagnetospirillum marisnigri]OAN49279.1 hypothetical protein A6A04_03955 [Paramagnetospirillum marisnigri]
MTAQWIGVIAATIWFVMFMLGHLAWVHLTGERRFALVLRNAFKLSLAGCALSITIYCGMGGGNASMLLWLTSMVIGPMIMACAFVLYIPFIFVIATSLSVETILMLDEAGGTLPRQALYDRFVSAEAVRARLEIMRGNGLFTLGEDGRYLATEKAFPPTRFFLAVKRMWNLGSGG